MRKRHRADPTPEDERWGLVLAILLGTYLVGSLVTGRVGRLVLVVLVALAVAGIAQVDGLDRRLRLVNLAALAWLVATTLLELIVHHDLALGMQALAFTLTFASAGAAIVSRVARHSVVTMRTVLGALDVYILLGFTFAGIYATVWAWDGQFFAQLDTPDLGDFIYFSSITLTTVGFGDLTPATPLARSLTAIEAFLGQIFLVTAVARLVSVIGQARPRRDGATHPSQDGPDEPRQPSEG